METQIACVDDGLTVGGGNQKRHSPWHGVVHGERLHLDISYANALSESSVFPLHRFRGDSVCSGEIGAFPQRRERSLLGYSEFVLKSPLAYGFGSFDNNLGDFRTVDRYLLIQKRDVLEVIQVSMRDQHPLNEGTSVLLGNLVIALDIAYPEGHIVTTDLLDGIFDTVDLQQVVPIDSVHSRYHPEFHQIS